MKKYICNICGYIYEEAAGIPSVGISPGTKWEALPEDWVCPLCGASKSEFTEQAAPVQADTPSEVTQITEMSKEKPRVEPWDMHQEADALKEMTPAQMSALCSNLAKGCEKQYLGREAELFWKLADYYQEQAGVITGQDMSALSEKINEDLEVGFAEAKAAAGKKPDRGALRVLTWSEKATRILDSLIKRYEREGDSMLEHTNIYVCEICGFIYVGDVPPEICPICKVPNKKLTKVERR